MREPNITLEVEQHSKSMLAGMQLACVSWPKILTPTEVALKAKEDYIVMFTQFPHLAHLLPEATWIEYYTRGYAWQSGQLMSLWGYMNRELAAAILAGES